MQFLAVINHTKPSYKQVDIVYYVYILRRILNGLIDTGCMQSKIPVSLNLQFLLLSGTGTILRVDDGWIN